MIKFGKRQQQKIVNMLKIENDGFYDYSFCARTRSNFQKIDI